MYSQYETENRFEYVRLIKRAIEDQFVLQGIRAFREGASIDLSQTFKLLRQWETNAGTMVFSSFYADVVARATNEFLDSHVLNLYEYSLKMENFVVTIKADFYCSDK